MPFDPSKPYSVAFDPQKPFKKASPGAAGEIGGGLETLYEAIPFLNDARDNIGAFAKTGLDLAQGKSSFRRPTTFREAIERVPEAFAATGRDLMANRRAGQAQRRSQADDFKDRRPNLAALTSGTGLALQAAPALLTGGATVAPAVARSAPRGLMGSTARALKPTADVAVTGGLAAQLTGLGSDGTLRERVERANEATLPAMAFSSVIPGSMALASKGRRVTADMARGAGRATARLANRASGGRLLDPRQEAAKRLGEALKADGLGPQEVRLALQEWQRTGASSPALMDLAGENTRALLRAAGGKSGPARNAAVRYVDQVTADLQDNALSRTRALTPDDNRPAVRAAADLEARQGQVADEMYPEPYATPVAVGDDVIDALRDEPGRAALRRARAAAVARRNDQQVAEIDALLNASDTAPVGEVSGGTLDRVRIAMAGRGAKAQQSPDTRDIAGGLFSRAADIDAALDEVPGLVPARQTYRGIQAQRDAMERGGAQPFADPEQYADDLARLREMATPDDNPFPVSADDIGSAAQVGLRSELERMIGAPAANATGTLNRLATGTNTERVLGETFGGDEAGRYRAAIQNEIDRVANARFISPNTGSQTAPRLDDEGLVQLPSLSKIGIAKALFDKLRRGVSLTPEERQALIEIGTTIVRTGDDIPNLPTTPQAMRLMSPDQRRRLSRAMAQFEGSREALASQPIE